MALDLNKGRASRGMENPLSAIFDLADDVSVHSRYVKGMVWYAIIFMIFWMFFNLILVLQTLNQGNLGLFTLLLGILISGFLAIWLIMRTHIFFKYFTHRYTGIKTVRDSEQPVPIPKGATVEDRYLKYLQKTHPPLEKLLKRTPGVLKRPASLTDKSGNRYEFDIYLSLPPSTSWKLFRMGGPGYGLFIKRNKGKPKLADILDLKKSVQNIAEAHDIVPSRVVLLNKFPGHYNGLSDDLYSFLVREEFKINLRGKTFYPVIQVVGETAEGYYDFTPLVPEFADRLP
ncbi:MAG: hypothetical protein JSV49_00620 [Thermoplasmata archaeon]|nr:MAG: hypothetical protein JSV49_00620 [Thermoplasmata archaeon]